MGQWITVKKGSRNITRLADSKIDENSINYSYHVPLTSRVEELATDYEKVNNVTDTKEKKVTFTEPSPGNKIARKWARRMERKKTERVAPESTYEITVNDPTKSAVVDTGATSSCGRKGDEGAGASSNKTI